ncbi:MAG: putative transporter YfdV [Burkholderiaceae bacterium]|nr:putative transporter YfdV [Burkholderiaceae bacterium]
MLAIVNIVLPVFALIFAGYAFRRMNILSATASVELNRFVVYLALPALMIDVMINTPWQTLYQPGFLLAFELAVALVFIPVLAFHWHRLRNLVGATVNATAASYANTGYIGLPLCALTFGQDNLAPAMVAAILTVSANFAVSIVLMEWGLQTEKNLWRSLKNVAWSLLKNPLIVAPMLAGLVCASGFALPHGLALSVKLLGNAASPCALVGIGLFLAQKQEAGNLAVSVELVLIKLVAQPLLAWWLAYHVFAMPPLWAKSAVLLSALPTGTGPYMLAELYRRGGGIASRTILWSTFGSVITLSFWLAFL